MLLATLALLAALGADSAPQTLTFEAADGTTVFADHYAQADRSAPLILLFHQASSNRGEYNTIAPRLAGLGYAALAIDQRSGATRWDQPNRTVDARGGSAGYLDALADLEAALAWARGDGGYTGPIVVWGSSYSAALVFLLAAEKGSEVSALLSFSPGEYLGKEGLVATNAEQVRVPVLILAPPSEHAQAAAIHAAVAAGDKHLVIPERAVHGSSMLIPQRNAGAEAIWPEVERFLARVTRTEGE